MSLYTGFKKIMRFTIWKVFLLAVSEAYIKFDCLVASDGFGDYKEVNEI